MDVMDKPSDESPGPFWCETGLIEDNISFYLSVSGAEPFLEMRLKRRIKKMNRYRQIIRLKLEPSGFDVKTLR